MRVWFPRAKPRVLVPNSLLLRFPELGFGIQNSKAAVERYELPWRPSLEQHLWWVPWKTFYLEKPLVHQRKFPHRINLLSVAKFLSTAAAFEDLET